MRLTQEVAISIAVLVVAHLGSVVCGGVYAEDAEKSRPPASSEPDVFRIDGQPETSSDVSDSDPEGISGSRQLLDLLGIDQSQFDRLTDGVVWQEGEDEILLKIIYRFPRFRSTEIEAWARDDLSQAELAEDPESHRGEIFSLSGAVVSADRIEPIPEIVRRFELRHYYRCRFMIDGRQPVVVFAADIPDSWKLGEPIEEPSSARGIFLKLGEEQGGQPVPYFVAPRIAWHPADGLGDLGMDVGLLDDLKPPGSDDGQPPAADADRRKLNDLRLTQRNRECFYQMLAAAGRAEPGELILEATGRLKASGLDQFSVVPLFNDPTGQHGRLAVVSGTAREVIRIRVEDEDVQARFGIDHYYQVFVFTDDSQGNPLVFCVRELPEGMPTGSGTKFGEYVTVAGFFFNTWAYQSRKPPDPTNSQSQWQLAPLLIGRDLVWHQRPQSAADPTAGLIAGGVFVLVVLAVWVALWRYSRGDRQFHETTIARQREDLSGVSLDKLDLDAAGPPDFSGLDSTGPSDDDGKPDQ